MIKIKDLKKSYQNGEVINPVLKGINLTVEDGEFVVILGPSGCGKSTLLNCISGLEKADAGSICYDELDILTLKDKELTEFRRKTTAFVFQNYYLLNSLSVAANIKMGANLSSNKDIQPIIEAIGLKGKENTYPSKLSGGEQQRVSIARALAKNPSVLFCDEPTGALDEETGRTVLKYLISLQKERKFTIIMVTHNQNIAFLAQKIIKMNSGNIAEVIQNQPKTVDEIGW